MRICVYASIRLHDHEFTTEISGKGITIEITITLFFSTTDSQNSTTDFSTDFTDFSTDFKKSTTDFTTDFTTDSTTDSTTDCSYRFFLWICSHAWAQAWLLLVELLGSWPTKK